VSIDIGKDEAKIMNKSDVYDDENDTYAGCYPSSISERIEEEAKLEKVLALVQPIVIMKHVEALDHSEISEKLGLTVGSSKSTLCKAMNKIRSQLKNEFDSI
jgi:DNA-directed RNA polymerase specialized sigma24 family protein